MNYNETLQDINNNYDYIKLYFVYYDDTIFIGETAHQTVVTVANNKELTVKEFTISDYDAASALYELADTYNELTDAQSAFSEESCRWWSFEEEKSGIADDIYYLIDDMSSGLLENEVEQ